MEQDRPEFLDADVHSTQVGADVLMAVQQELEQSLSQVREMEADADAKGIPLNLMGARYRIYETTLPQQ